jgi:hypothetical protein
MRRTGLVMALAAAACATVPQAEAGPPVERLTYETRQCLGRCPVYRVTVGADGEGLFEGREFTAVEGERRFRVTARQFEAFARHLAPLRPSAGTVRYAGERCAMHITDMPAAEVTWRSGSARQRRYFYYGCDPQRNRAMAQRLNSAPSLLPIGAFIGPNR